MTPDEIDNPFAFEFERQGYQELFCHNEEWLSGIYAAATGTVNPPLDVTDMDLARAIIESSLETLGAGIDKLDGVSNLRAWAERWQRLFLGWQAQFTDLVPTMSIEQLRGHA